MSRSGSLCPTVDTVTGEQSKPQDDSSATSEARDPLSPLATGAAAVHELFLAYSAAGFTERQALRLIAAIIVEQQNRPKG